MSQLARAEWVSLYSVTDCFAKVQLSETAILAFKNPDPFVQRQKTSPFFLTVLAPSGIVKVYGDAFGIIWKLLGKKNCLSIAHSYTLKCLKKWVFCSVSSSCTVVLHLH